jgi:hypothetical protein
LGCLEGGYSVELARLGFREVVGIEVRKANFDKCRFVKERLAFTSNRSMLVGLKTQES